MARVFARWARELRVSAYILNAQPRAAPIHQPLPSQPPVAQSQAQLTCNAEKLKAGVRGAFGRCGHPGAFKAARGRA